MKTMVGSSLPPVFVEGIVSYLRYLSLFAHRGVKYILCCVFCFVCLRLVFCVPNVASFSGLSILDCRSVFFNLYLNINEQ